MIQQIRGKWSFLEDIGKGLGQYALLRDQKRQQQKGEDANQADVLFKLASAGALPDGLDGRAVSALQSAGVTPDALFSINKRTKGQQAQADEATRLSNERTKQLIDQSRAQSEYDRARAAKLDAPTPPEVNTKKAMDAAKPWAISQLSWEESWPQMQALPEYQGIPKATAKTFYDAAVREYKDERAREQRIARGSGEKPMPVNSQLNFWQDLAGTAVQSALQARGLLTSERGTLTPQQRDQVLSDAIDIVNRNPNPQYREQFSKGLGLSHFRAALAGAEKAARPTASQGSGGVGGEADRLIAEMRGVGGAAAPPQQPGQPAPRAATVDDVRQAMAAVGEDEAKVRQWLLSKGIQPPGR